MFVSVTGPAHVVAAVVSTRYRGISFEPDPVKMRSLDCIEPRMLIVKESLTILSCPSVLSYVEQVQKPIALMRK